jgi:diguanylate cyclase (GGDEF)-like protein
VCFVDLDKFKDINDTLGHDAGDEVLRVIARRMRSVLRHTDKIARMGGDEFYVLIEDLNDGFHAAEVAGKLLEEACRSVCVDGIECRLSASIGISIYPDDGSEEQSLLQRADSAMYKAKESGKNAYRFFSAEADRTRVTNSLAVQHALLAAGSRFSYRDREFAVHG